MDHPENINRPRYDGNGRGINSEGEVIIIALSETVDRALIHILSKEHLMAAMRSPSHNMYC